MLIQHLVLKNKKGFTIVEIVVAVMIILVLVTVTTVSLSVGRRKARDSKRVRDLQAISTALQIYYNEKGVFPVTNSIDDLEAILSPTYMRDFPSSPETSGSYLYRYGNDCTLAAADSLGYGLWAELETSGYANDACGCMGNTFCICDGICTSIPLPY